jgi:hypothetical protein
MAKIIDRGSAKPDDPIYSSGLTIGGKRSKPSTQTSPATTAGTTPASTSAPQQPERQPETTGSRTPTGPAIPPRSYSAAESSEAAELDRRYAPQGAPENSPALNTPPKRPSPKRERRSWLS